MNFAVVSAYNEGHDIRTGNLRHTLDGLVATQRAGILDQIIVVDDGSTDFTAEIAESFPVRLIRHLKEGKPHNKGKTDAVLTALPYCQTAQQIMFIDGDMLNPTPDRIGDIFRSARPIDIKMVIAAYWQMNDPKVFCDQEYSGTRLVKTGALQPWMDTQHPDHHGWKDCMQGSGFGFEVFLDLLIPLQERYVCRDLQLESAPRAKHASCTNIHNQRALAYSRYDRWQNSLRRTQLLEDAISSSPFVPRQLREWWYSRMTNAELERKVIK